MNKRRSGALISYIYSITQVVVNLLYVPILLAGIGQAEYGLYQMVGSIIAYLSIINSTFSAGAVRFYSKYYVLGDEEGMANTLGILRRIYRVAYLIVAGATAAAVGVVIAVYQNSLSPWEIQESCMMLGILALNLMLTMENTVSIACITAHEEFAFLKLSQLCLLVVQPVIIILLIKRFPFALTVTAVQLICNLLLVVSQNVFSKRKLGMDTRMRFLDKKLEHQIITFSGTIVLATIADQIFWRADQLILAYMYGTVPVAVYAVGSQVVNTYLPLGVAVASVFMPRVSELWHKDHDLKAISDLFVRVSRVTLYPLLAVLLGFIIFGRDFIRLWAGDGYDAAYWVAVFELVPFTVDVAQNIGLTILQVMDRYGFRAKMYFVAAVINIGLTIWLAQALGIVGAAIASGIAMTVSSGFVLNWYYQKKIGMDMIGWWKSVLQEIVPMLALCIAGSVVWRPFAGCGWSGLVAGILCWAVAFTLVSYFLCANEYEKSLVRGAVQKALKMRR
ncbi:lipopolysaccharide biosynthesis protein [Olsenella sp. YH-ols2221]|uniref:lipopolysaccharide biosynthesis protein n=1 Tax=Olsenella kribbiana TaxID=3115221 RepID=UPI002ED97C82